MDACFPSTGRGVRTCPSRPRSGCVLRDRERPDVYTLDVHVPEQRHVEGTDAFIPYDAIHAHRDLLPDDGTTPIALYCRSDDMSREAADVLSELGYEEIHHLRGGIRAWEECDLPPSEHRFDEPDVRAVTSDSDEVASDEWSRP